MKTRKLLAVVLAVALLASFISVPVFADGHEGGILEDLGILEGTDEDGVTPAYLASTATRAQAALIHLRLFGLEEEALAFPGTETFLDAADATEFWQPVLEYLKANPELGWRGDDMGNFMPTAAINGQQFTKVLLVALGYVEDENFTYDETMTFAAGIGLDALADMAAEDLTMEDVAVALVQALGLETTGVEEWTLASQLVADGLIDKDAAEAAGFVITDPVFKVVSAEATGVKEVTVTMTTDIPAGTTVLLKKGTIGIVTTAVLEGAEATLTGMFELAPGTYTVTVGTAVSAPFVITAEAAASLDITATTVFVSGVQDLGVELLNQYGEAMSLAGANVSVFNTTNGFVYTPDTSGKTVKITTTTGTGGNTAKNDEVYVFIYDPASQLQDQQVLIAQANPYLADMEIVSWTWNVGTTETAARFYAGDTTAQMVVSCVDQYNKPYVLTAADITTGSTYSNKIQVLSSNGAVLSAGAVGVSGGKLTFKAGIAGTAMFTFIIPDQGVVVSSEMITVYNPAVLTTVEAFAVVGATNAGGAVVAAEANTVTAVGKDQYQTVVKFTSADASKFSFSTTNTSVLLPGGIAVGENKLTITPIAAGNVTVFVFLNGAMQGSFDLAVQAAAAPLYISAVGVEAAMETGVSDTVVAADVTVMDQYNRKITLSGDWSYKITAATSQTHVSLTGSAVEYTLDTDGLTKGSDTFTALLTDDGDVQEESGFAFTIRNVAATEIDGLAIADIPGPMYLGPLYATWGATEAAYHKTIKITGTVGDLVVKLLDSNADGVPNVVDLITSTNDNVQVSGAALKPATALADNKAGTTTIKVWRNGKVEDSASIELSTETPDLMAIECTDINAINWSLPETIAMTAFRYYDQYGVVRNPAYFNDGYLVYDYPKGADDFAKVFETEIWWFSVIKHDGTVWKSIYFNIDDIFPTG